MKPILLAIAKLLFRFRVFNSSVLNTPGPVLLVPNHVSWLDWLFLLMLLDKDWKFVVSRSVAERSWLYHRKVVTCYLRGANRLKWSHHPGRREWFPRVSAHFSEALDSPVP
ncbi:MAG: 1-acyl-sn-glycerol-3-phosphate acyltransferase, partial [Verrucomicrobiales bacterium]|nr:1-acyl-sn-glycerol-3-phosphate acyltransferase [Verrucomicrobiales bacterium]